MAEQAVALLAFNRGLISRLGMARADVKRVAMAAEIMTNWMCRVLGSMMLRPGMGYIGNTANDNPSRTISFIFSNSDVASLEFTNLLLRVWVNDALITRPAVASAVADGTFVSAASLAANWVDADEAGAVSSWVSGGRVGFTGTGTKAAIRTQTVAVATPGVEHALHIVVERGPITLRVGSTAGGDEYVSEATLATGTHSIAFTPAAGNFYIQFLGHLERIVYLNQCTIEAAGVMTLPTVYTSADLGKLRTDQSADVVYVPCSQLQQRKIERRGTGRSWSIVLFLPNDGPFRTANIGVTTMVPSVLAGNGTLTASMPFFRAGHLGALFAVTSTGQDVQKSMTAPNDVTASIRVVGVGTDRAVTINITALTGTGNTVILERSFDNSIWVAVPGENWIVDTAEAYTDGLDNQIIFYRLKASVYAAGATLAELIIALGSVRGICRVTAVTSNTAVQMEVLTNFGGTTPTNDWEEGTWSDYRGWPSAVRLYDGRLNWSGKDRFVGSISDGFESYDPTVLGDSGVINRAIGSGPVDSINFMVALQRLVLGGQAAEYSCRSSALDEPLTPANFNIKKGSRQGSSSAVDAAQIDNTAVYVQRGGIRVFELTFESYPTYEYTSTQLSQLIPTIGYPGIVRIGVQRQPDTRLHFVRSDGSVAVLVFDSVEDVKCWLNITSPAAGGAVEDVDILPGAEGEQEDHVYYTVRRTINGVTRRYRERWATENQAKGDQAACMLADAYITGTGPIVGLGALEGESVAVWADGKDIGTIDNDDGTVTYAYTVTGGVLTPAPPTVTTWVVGLPYKAQWKSAKLVQIQSQLGSSLTNMEIIDGLGIIAADLHPKGIRFGQDFDHLDSMPSVEEGTPIDQDAIETDYDTDPTVFPGTWTNDARLCLEAQSPRPATVLACICNVHAND